MELSKSFRKTIPAHHEIVVSGRIDSATAPEFDGELKEMITRDPKSIIVNCSALEYICSAGLRALNGARLKLAENGQVIELVGCNDLVNNTLTLVGFHPLFPRFANLEDALDGLSKKS